MIEDLRRVSQILDCDVRTEEERSQISDPPTPGTRSLPGHWRRGAII